MYDAILRGSRSWHCFRHRLCAGAACYLRARPAGAVRAIDRDDFAIADGRQRDYLIRLAPTAVNLVGAQPHAHG